MYKMLYPVWLGPDSALSHQISPCLLLNWKCLLSDIIFPVRYIISCLGNYKPWLLLVIFSLTNKLRLFRPFISPLECANTHRLLQQLQLCTSVTFNIFSSNARQCFFNTYFPIFRSFSQFWELDCPFPSRNLYFGGAHLPLSSHILSARS